MSQTLPENVLKTGEASLVFLDGARHKFWMIVEIPEEERQHYISRMQFWPMTQQHGGKQYPPLVMF